MNMMERKKFCFWFGFKTIKIITIQNEEEGAPKIKETSTGVQEFSNSNYSFFKKQCLNASLYISRKPCLEYLKPLQKQISEKENNALYHCSALELMEHLPIIIALSPLNHKAFLYACAYTQLNLNFKKDFFSFFSFSLFLHMLCFKKYIQYQKSLSVQRKS